MRKVNYQIPIKNNTLMRELDLLCASCGIVLCEYYYNNELNVTTIF